MSSSTYMLFAGWEVRTGRTSYQLEIVFFYEDSGSASLLPSPGVLFFLNTLSPRSNRRSSALDLLPCS